jgi:hypothetical protein
MHRPAPLVWLVVSTADFAIFAGNLLPARMQYRLWFVSQHCPPLVAVAEFSIFNLRVLPAQSLSRVGAINRPKVVLANRNACHALERNNGLP